MFWDSVYIGKSKQVITQPNNRIALMGEVWKSNQCTLLEEFRKRFPGGWRSGNDEACLQDWYIFRIGVKMWAIFNEENEPSSHQKFKGISIESRQDRMDLANWIRTLSWLSEFITVARYKRCLKAITWWRTSLKEITWDSLHYMLYMVLSDDKWPQTYDYIA